MGIYRRYGDMSTILYDAEKKAIWNDREKLGETIKTLAIRLNSVGRLRKDFYEKSIEAKIAMEQAETKVKILDEEWTQIDAAGKELTKRLMELEKEAGEL
jgi:hypothetical protein